MKYYSSDQSEVEEAAGLLQIAASHKVREGLYDKKRLSQSWHSLTPARRLALTLLTKQLFPKDIDAQEKVISALLIQDSLQDDSLKSEITWMNRYAGLFS